MASKKPKAKASVKKVPAKKAPAKKVKKVKSPAKVRANEEREDMFPAAMRLGDLLWEYRAKMAEWEKAFADSKFSTYKLDKEKSDPKYQKLLLMLAQEAQVKAEVKRCGDTLKEVQERAAKSLGISTEEFLKSCTIDHITGVVRYLD